jgi:hypothetical protein
MTRRRAAALASLLVAGGIGLAGCAPAEGASPATPVDEVATLEEGTDGGPGTVHLSQAAVDRLDLRTTAVTSADGVLVIPYGAVVYEPDGSSWAYVQTADRTYQRQAIAIAGISGDTAALTSGPPAGALVVSQGAAELVGVETGIDGEE